MELSKLKLEKFKHIKVVNFPTDIKVELDSTDNEVEVIIYYIDKIEDVKDFVELSNSSNLPKENRTIMVYKKGRKDGVNRDSIFLPFKEQVYKGFKLKAPMLCSISKDLSACVMCKEIG